MIRMFLATLVAMLAATASIGLAQTTSAKVAHGSAPAVTFPEGVPSPVIADKFTADPHVVVIGDAYYIYPTVDKENWMTTEFNVWSSKDLIHWKDEGVILDLAGEATGHSDVSWAKIRAWAPGVVAQNGKVYDYFCGDTNIGVAVADKPTGPFKDALGVPLVAKGAYKGQMIDPMPFIDDVPAPGEAAGGEPQAYLYFGNGNLYVAKLKSDMISLVGPATRIPVAGNGAAFREGIFVIKRKGTYYFMWSEDDARSANYRVAYGTADSPLGPIQIAKDRVILSKSGLRRRHRPSLGHQRPWHRRLVHRLPPPRRPRRQRLHSRNLPKQTGIRPQPGRRARFDQAGRCNTSGISRGLQGRAGDGKTLSFAIGTFHRFRRFRSAY